MIDLMPDEQPDLDKIISDEIESVTDKIRFSADWFTTGAYMNLWKRYHTEFLDENTKIRESLQSLGTYPNDTNEQFRLLINLLEGLRRVFKASHDQWQRRMMAEFLESDLPLEMYGLYNISYIRKMLAIKSFSVDLAKMQTRLHVVGSDEKKITAELKKFENNHRGLSKALAMTFRSEFMLRFFLKAVNATELKDLFKTKPLTLNTSTERNRFAEYLDEFRQSLFELTGRLDKKHLNEDIMILNASDSESFDDFDKKLRQTVLRHV